MYVVRKITSRILGSILPEPDDAIVDIAGKHIL